MQKFEIIKLGNMILNYLGVDPSTIFLRKSVEFDAKLKVTTYVEQALKSFILSKGFKPETLETEGESKKVYRIPNTKVCLISLKPTMYSFTHNRYGTVENIDKIRDKFWRLFATEINDMTVDYITKGQINYSTKILGLLPKVNLDKEYPFITSYLGNSSINGQMYNICLYVDDQTPLELVWKDYFLGTMKHTLINVPDWKTRSGVPIEVEGKMPNEIMRFDWRNPFEYEGVRTKDEAIPDDFAAFYTDVPSAKATGLIVSNVIKEFLGRKGYTFVDTCYFINMKGNVVYSEITPDGMRIRKEGSSFDKDLWRIGKEEGKLLEAWLDLYKDLTE